MGYGSETFQHGYQYSFLNFCFRILITVTKDAPNDQGGKGHGFVPHVVACSGGTERFKFGAFFPKRPYNEESYDSCNEAKLTLRF